LVEQHRADALADAIALLNALADWGVDDLTTARRR
jgi:hypothetical protein